MGGGRAKISRIACLTAGMVGCAGGAVGNSRRVPLGPLWPGDPFFSLPRP